MNAKCSICNQPVNINDLHPDSLPVPTDGSEYTVYHTGCANGEDRWNGANPSDEDLADERAWVVLR